jgi:hypothetical protein
MLPQKFDITLALKAIALTDRLNGTEKRIAVAVLDHFNRKTGRCDPSYETLAKLLRVHPRTIGRGVTKVVKVGFLKKVRHGGNNRCNSYRPPGNCIGPLKNVGSASVANTPTALHDRKCPLHQGSLVLLIEVKLPHKPVLTIPFH